MKITDPAFVYVSANATATDGVLARWMKTRVRNESMGESGSMVPKADSHRPDYETGKSEHVTGENQGQSQVPRQLRSIIK